MKVAVVVPTIREMSIREFLHSWRDEFRETHILIVEDNPARSFALGEFPNVTHYSWADIDRDLGADAWIIPRRTDCVRSYGFYKAFQDGAEMIVSLDDDCIPEPGSGEYLMRHWRRLNEVVRLDAWEPTMVGLATRGVPYYATARRWPVALNHGMWTGVPDFDAPTQLVASRMPLELRFEDQTIPVGKYFPMCGMNVAFRREAAPAMYFMLMGKGYEFDRFGDIWAGVVLKKICDHLGFVVNSGAPSVHHRRASDVWANLRKEVAGLEANERFWQAVDKITLTGLTFEECMREIAQGLKLEGDYWSKLRSAMHVWAGLFDRNGAMAPIGSDQMELAAPTNAAQLAPTP